jgi:hypothetical protein
MSGIFSTNDYNSNHVVQWAIKNYREIYEEKRKDSAPIVPLCTFVGMIIVYRL